ncbi:MAG: CRISPR-associated endonuclease Cas3'', partial [Burkholderiales bacterium]|nr:CRISPR-associated endonuclease Cas3'' [Burkholderiales bacterium]
MQERGYFRYWGKALDNSGITPEYHLLPYHSLDVAAVGHEFLSAHPSFLRSLQTQLGIDDEETCLAWAVFFLALHDLGKFSEAFQNLRPDLLRLLLSRTSRKVYPSGFHHDSMGFLLWCDRLSDRLIEEDWLRIGQRLRIERGWADVFMAWISAVTGHHGKPPKRGREQLVGAYGHFAEEDTEAALQFVRQVAALL